MNFCDVSISLSLIRVRSIRDVDAEAMETLIEFCYTATVKIDERNVQSLLPAACLLQLAEVQVKSGNSMSRFSNNGDNV